jgi:hypothetical protein
MESSQNLELQGDMKSLKAEIAGKVRLGRTWMPAYGMWTLLPDTGDLRNFQQRTFYPNQYRWGIISVWYGLSKT